MHLDQYGLPCQANGDANDQLQRVGMIIAASAILDDDSHMTVLELNCLSAIQAGGLLQVYPQTPGTFVRHVGGDPSNVSADQLISVLGAFIAIGATEYAYDMFKACIKRFGFAQNTHDGLSEPLGNPNGKWKLPDFMLARALPLFTRMHWSLYPAAILADIYLIILAIGAVIDKNPDHVDDNDTVLTLAVCACRMPTPLSWLARKIYSKLRPWNYGCTTLGFNRVQGALNWYHRAESGGNPEIAEMWKPICERLF